MARLHMPVFAAQKYRPDDVHRSRADDSPAPGRACVPRRIRDKRSPVRTHMAHGHTLPTSNMPTLWKRKKQKPADASAPHGRTPALPARALHRGRTAHISCGRALSESRHRSAVRHMNADCPRKTRQRTKHGTSEGHCTRIVIIIIHCRVSLASTAARVCVQVCGRRAPRSSPRIRSTPDDLAGPFPPTDLRSLCLRRLSRANAASWCSKLMQQAHAASWCSKLVQQRVSRA